MDQKNPAPVLNEIRNLLLEYSKTHSSAQYITLLEQLGTMTSEFREEERLKGAESWKDGDGSSQPRRKTAGEQLSFTRGAASTLVPNVTTRSHKQSSMDEEDSPEDAEHMSISDDAEQNALFEEAYVASTSEQEPLVACRPLFTEPSESMTSAVGPTAVPDDKIRIELNSELVSCKNRFRSNGFVVNCGDNLEDIQPTEIDGFFSAFEESKWLTDRQLMPLLFSFSWPTTTLVLHSSYLQEASILDSKPSSERIPWPSRPDHDRIILPCCFKSHWTLFDIDLKSGTVKNYDSLIVDDSPKELILVIKQQLAYIGERDQRREFKIEKPACQQQNNGSDCGIFMLHNAHILVTKQDQWKERFSGLYLRLYYLKRLLELERQEGVGREMVNMILPRNTNLRLKRRRRLEDIEVESDDDQGGKRNCRAVWEPPNDLGPPDIWKQERDNLTIVAGRYGGTAQEQRERAEELLRMIEAIGCKEVMMAWTEVVTQKDNRVPTTAKDASAKAICQIVERSQTRSFKDVVLSRLGKFLFTTRILQDVTKFRKEPRTDSQTQGKGNAVTRAFAKFVEEAHPEMVESFRTREIGKYRNWWREGQIWVLLSGAYSPGILLLIPGGQRLIWNEQFVRIRSEERTPFVNALQRLRQDLFQRLSDSGRYLKYLQDDVIDLIGHAPDASPTIDHEKPAVSTIQLDTGSMPLE